MRWRTFSNYQCAIVRPITEKKRHVAYKKKAGSSPPLGAGSEMTSN
jgi:hypothetical protein